MGWRSWLCGTVGALDVVAIFVLKIGTVSYVAASCSIPRVERVEDLVFLGEERGEEGVALSFLVCKRRYRGMNRMSE